MHLLITNGHISGSVLLWVAVAIALVLVLAAFLVGRAVGRSAPRPYVTPEQIARDWGKCRVCGGLAARMCSCRGGPTVA